MKSGRPAKITQALARVKKSPARKPADLTDPKLAALTARFQELQAQAYRDLVGAAVELGDILRTGKPLTGASYGAWLEELGVSRKSADNYMAMAALARTNPQALERWKELGPTKLYRVARLPAGAQREVLQPKKRDEILQMNDREFSALVEPHLPRSTASFTPAQKAHGLRQKASSWRRQLGDFRTYFGKHAPEARPAELVAELRALKKDVDELLAAF
jgi:hypothetical protein